MYTSLLTLDRLHYTALIEIFVHTYIALGVKHIGCYEINNTSDIQPTNNTSSNHGNRKESLRQCAQDAVRYGYSYFALGYGKCYTGSDSLRDHINWNASSVCSEGNTQMSVDVYFIYDREHLSNNSYCYYSNCLEQGGCSGAIKSVFYNVQLLLFSWYVCWLFVFR